VKSAIQRYFSEKNPPKHGESKQRKLGRGQQMVRGEDHSSSQFDKSTREDFRGNERLPPQIIAHCFTAHFGQDLIPTSTFSPQLNLVTAHTFCKKVVQPVYGIELHARQHKLIGV
jgi:hypothetical protein